MAVTPTSLRALFPEFSDNIKYPDPMIDQWVTIAAGMLDAGRWGALLDYGTTLFVCHRLALAAKNAKIAQFGGVPGQASGILQSKSVDKVSQSYDTSSAAEADAGFWNLTTYGQEYIRQARIVGAGPMTVGTDGNASSALNAYAGPGWYPGYGY